MKSFNSPELRSANGPIFYSITLFVEKTMYAAKLLSDAQRPCAFNSAIEPSRGRSSMAQPARAEFGVHPIPEYLAMPGTIGERRRSHTEARRALCWPTVSGEAKVDTSK